MTGVVRMAAGALCGALASGACAASTEVYEPSAQPVIHDAGPLGDASAFAAADSLIVLPDTQFYACAYPDIFQQQTRWVAEQHASGRVAAVLHTGDVVDMNVSEQWDVARDAFALLGGDVPYLVTSGNHDLDTGRHSLASEYLDLGIDAFEQRGGEAGCFDAQRGDNAYAVTTLAGERWLLLGLEFGARDAVVEWADQVLERHADLPAILFTHAYLDGDGTRYDRNRPGQAYHPDTYHVTPRQGVADGEDLYRMLVEPHENVRVVLSGHVIPDGVAYSISTRPSGSVVHEILANYQFCAVCPCEQSEGGGGYLRLMQLAGDTMHVRTYSPHRDEWLEDADNQFDFSVR